LEIHLIKRQIPPTVGSTPPDQDVSVVEDGLKRWGLRYYMGFPSDLFQRQFKSIVLEVIVELFKTLRDRLATIFCEQDLNYCSEGKRKVNILLSVISLPLQAIEVCF